MGSGTNGVGVTFPSTSKLTLVTVSIWRGLRLIPGLQVNAEIHLGTRSVLEYLLSPVQKIAHDAGRER
jgi:hypothetical protein